MTASACRARSLVRFVDVLLGQTGVRVLLQVAADPVAGVNLFQRVEQTVPSAATTAHRVRRSVFFVFLRGGAEDAAAAVSDLLSPAPRPDGSWRYRYSLSLSEKR